MADVTLIGVVVGGAIALVGQGGVLVVQTTAEKRRDKSAARAAARLQRDDFSAALDAVAESLRTNEWWSDVKDVPLGARLEDRRLLAAHLDAPSFRRVASSLRRFSQLRAERNDGHKQGVCTLNEENLFHVAACFFDLDEGRHALANLAEYPLDVYPQPKMTEELETRAREEVRAWRQDAAST